MFGYWLGMNKLQKTEALSYQDGDLALFVFDNKIARIQTPMDIPVQKEIAAWMKTQHPANFKRKVTWHNEFKKIGLLQTVAADCRGYNTLHKEVTTWITRIDEGVANNSAWLLCDIAELRCPQWLLEKLLLGGMAYCDAKNTAKTIVGLVRANVLQNWSARRLHLWPKPEKFTLRPKRKNKNKSWGLQSPPNNTIAIAQGLASTNHNPDQPTAHHNQNTTIKIAKMTYRKPNEILRKPTKRYVWETYGVKPNAVDLAQRAIGEAHRQQQAVKLKLAKITQNNVLVPAKCGSCKVLQADRVWKDLGGVALCKLCRCHEEQKRFKKRLEKKVDIRFCSLCGTHAAGSSAWSSSENGSHRCRWCSTHAARKLHTIYNQVQVMRQNQTRCDACNVTLSKKRQQKHLRKGSLVLCPTCHKGATHPLHQVVLLLREGVRQIATQQHITDGMLHRMKVWIPSKL